MQDAERNASPRADEWSFAQVIEHLVLVEEGLTRSLQDPDPTLPQERPFFSLLPRLMVSFVLRNGIRVPVPDGAPIPGLPGSWSTLVERWAAAHEALTSAVTAATSGQQTFVFRHPRAGLLSRDETLLLLSDHARYHLVRARRVWPTPLSARVRK